MKTSNGQRHTNLALQMYDNNSGCCGEDEIPSEELTPNQIHKNKNGFRVKGEVKIRGRRTDRVIILPEDRYVYTATGPGVQNEMNPMDFYHTSTSSELSSTIKSLFGETVRRFITQKPTISQKVNSEVPAGDLKDESVEEDTINESLNKIYDYTSVKVSELVERPLKNTMKRKFFILTSCFRKSNCQRNLVQSTENFEMIIEDQCLIKELSELKSQTARPIIQEEELNAANKSYSEVHENRGDMKNINIIQTKLTKENTEKIVGDQAIVYHSLIHRPTDNIIQSNLEKTDRFQQKPSKIPILLRSSKLRRNGGSGENYFRNLVQSKPYADITNDDIENLQNSNQNIEEDITESLSNDSSQIEYYSELCNFHLPPFKQKPDKFYYCKKSYMRNSNNVDDNNHLFKQNKHQSDFQRKILATKKFEFSFRRLKDLVVYKFNNYIKSQFNASKPVKIPPEYSMDKNKSYNTFDCSEYNCLTKSNSFVQKPRTLSYLSNPTNEIKSFLDLITGVTPIIESSHPKLTEISIKFSVVKFEKSFVMPIQTPFYFYSKKLFNSNNRYKILKNSNLFGMYCLGSSNQLEKPNRTQLDESFWFRQGKITENNCRKNERHKIVSKVKLNFSNFHSNDLSNSLENISSISTSLMDSKNLMTKTKSMDYLNSNHFHSALKFKGFNYPSLNSVLTNNIKNKALVDEMNSNRIPPNPRRNSSKSGMPFELNDANPKNTYNISLHSEIKLIATLNDKNGINPIETNVQVFRYDFENDKSPENGVDFSNKAKSSESTKKVTSPFRSEIQEIDKDPHVEKITPIKKDELLKKFSKLSTNSSKRFQKRKRSNSDKAISVDVKDLKVPNVNVNKNPYELASFAKPIQSLSKREKSESTLGPYYEMMTETASIDDYAQKKSSKKVADKVNPNKATKSNSKINPRVKESRKNSINSFFIHQVSDVNLNIKSQENWKNTPNDDYECHLESLWLSTNLPSKTHNFFPVTAEDVNILRNQLQKNLIGKKFDRKQDKENLPIPQRLEPKQVNQKVLSNTNKKSDFQNKLSPIQMATDDWTIKSQEPKLFGGNKAIDMPKKPPQIQEVTKGHQVSKQDPINRRQSVSDLKCDCGDNYLKINENCKNLVLCKRNESNQLEIVRCVNNFKISPQPVDMDSTDCDKDLCYCAMCLDSSGNVSKQTIEICECKACCCCQCPRHKKMMPKYYCATVTQGNPKIDNKIIALKNFRNSNANTNLMSNREKGYRTKDIEFNNNNLNYLWSNQFFYHDPRSNPNFNFSQKSSIGEIPRKLENPMKKYPCYGSSVHVPMCKINHYCESKPRNRLERINFIRKKINLSKSTNISDVALITTNYSASKDQANSIVLESLIYGNEELIDNNSIVYSSIGFPISTKSTSTDRAVYQPIQFNNIIISGMKSQSFELSSHKVLSNKENKNLLDEEQNRKSERSIINQKDGTGNSANYLNLDNISVTSKSSVDKMEEIRISQSSMSERQASILEKFEVTSSEIKTPNNELLEKNEKKLSIDNEYVKNNELKNNETLPTNQFISEFSSKFSENYNMADNATVPSVELYNMNYEKPSVPLDPTSSSFHEDGYQNVARRSQESKELTESSEASNLHNFDIVISSGNISKSIVNTDENKIVQQSPLKHSDASPDNIRPETNKSSASLDDESLINSDDLSNKIDEKRSYSDSTTLSENHISNPNITKSIKSNKTNEKLSSKYSYISIDKGTENSYQDSSSISIRSKSPDPNLIKSSSKIKEMDSRLSQVSVNKTLSIKEISRVSSGKYDTNSPKMKLSLSSIGSNEATSSKYSQLSKERKAQSSSFREASTTPEKYEENSIKSPSLNKKNVTMSSKSSTEKLEKSPIYNAKSSRSSKVSTGEKLEKSPVYYKITSGSSQTPMQKNVEVSSLSFHKPTTQPSRVTTENEQISDVLSKKSNSSQYGSKNSSKNIKSSSKIPSKSSQIYKDSQLYYLTDESPLNKHEVQSKPYPNYLSEQVKDRNPPKSSPSDRSQQPILSNNLYKSKPNPIEESPKLKSSPKKNPSHEKSRQKHKRRSSKKGLITTPESIKETRNQRPARTSQNFHQDPKMLKPFSDIQKNKPDQMISKSTQKYESTNIPVDNKNRIKPPDTSRVEKIFDKLLHYTAVKRESQANKEIINTNLQLPSHKQGSPKNRTNKLANIDFTNTPSSSTESKDKNPSNSFHKYSLSNNSVLDHPFSVSVTSLNVNDLMNHDKLITNPVYVKDDSSTNKFEKPFERNYKEHSQRAFSDKFNSPKSTPTNISNTILTDLDREPQDRCSVPSFMTVKNTTYITAKDSTEINGERKDSKDSLNTSFLQIPYQNFHSSSTESLLKDYNINNLSSKFTSIEFYEYEFELIVHLNKSNLEIFETASKSCK